MIVVEVGGAPVGKGRARFSRATGHAYTPGKTRDYESAIKYAAHQIMNGRAPLTGPVVVKIEAFVPIPKSYSKGKQESALRGILRPTSRPDLDNYMKSITDGLNEIVWKDDSQIVTAMLEKRYSDRPRLRVEVQELLG